MSNRRPPSTSEVIHEMRNQLAVAMANLEACIDGKLAPTSERLKGTVQSLRELEELIKELRLLQSDVISPAHLSEINVCAWLKREYAAMQGVAAAKGVTLSVFTCPHTDHACEHFYGDPVRIGQIIKNVLLNAVRYTPPGGSVTINCSRRADQLQVAISDSGPGIEAEEKARIFEGGYRGAAAAATDGSGHGLAVVKKLVEEQGGSVAVSSVAGQGATFAVSLPGRPSGSHAPCAVEGCDLCWPQAT